MTYFFFLGKDIMWKIMMGGQVWKVMESQGWVLLIKQNVTSFIKMRELVMDKSSNMPWHPTTNIHLNKFGIHVDFQVLGVHPSNKRLLYLRVENQGLFSCDLLSRDKASMFIISVMFIVCWY